LLFAGNMELATGASIGGNALLFAGSVTLSPGADIRGNTVLFAGNMSIGSEAVSYGKLILFAGGLDLYSNAVLRNDALLFAGNAHLDPEAQVRGDLIMVEGNAALEGGSTVTGKLYLNSEPRPGMGRLDMSPEAQVGRGVSRSENIESVVSWQIGGWVLGSILLLLVPLVVIIGLLMALMFYLGRRTLPIQGKEGSKAREPESSPQPAAQ
jgi:hypothetical protein